MEVGNKRLTDDEFFSERQTVLAEWPTGKEVDLDEAIAYHKTLPPTKNFALKLAEAKRNGVILLNGCGGADTLERHIELLRYLQDKGQADVLPTWVDAMTRNHHYAEAEKAVKEAERTGKVVLNGLPIVHYGVAGTRKMIASVKLPVCIYANGPDIRLIAEIALAGGHTGTTMGGSLCAFWGYTGNLPLETVIRYYQYKYRLEGYYEERGVPIMTEIVGAVSGMISPSAVLAPTIIEALIAAEQGVKHMRLVNRFYGNLAQDIATAVTLRKLGREYLDKLGYKDVLIYILTHPPYGKFPLDDAQAFPLLGWSIIVAVLGGCDIAYFPTIDEGRQIPTKENNAATHRHNRVVLNILKDQKIDLLSNSAVVNETEMAEREAKAILDSVLNLGKGDAVVGAVRAVEAGVLDQPFAATQRTLSKVLGVRDAQGAVRYLDHGNFPFTRDIIEFHKEKIAERAKKEGREISYDAVIGDLFALSQGKLVSSPGWQAEALSAAK